MNFISHLYVSQACKNCKTWRRQNTSVNLHSSFSCTSVHVSFFWRWHVFYLNLDRKTTLSLHRLCLSIHVFHADWYTKKRGLFHINKVNKSKYSHSWNIDGQLYRRGFASADWSRYIDETSFFLKFLSTFNRYTSFPRVCWQNNFELNKESRNEANKYSFLKKKKTKKKRIVYFRNIDRILYKRYYIIQRDDLCAS